MKVHYTAPVKLMKITLFTAEDVRPDPHAETRCQIILLLFKMMAREPLITGRGLSWEEAEDIASKAIEEALKLGKK